MAKSIPTDKIKNNTVSIRVSGSGNNVWACTINDDTYSRILQNSEKEEDEEEEEEEDPADIIKSEYQAGQLVCWGLDVMYAGTVTLNLDGKSKELKIINTHEGYSISEALKDSKMRASSPFIELNSDTKEQLGENFDLSKFNHVFLELIECKYITLELTLPVDARDFDRRKLSLLVCDVDSGTELCRLTYNQGLLGSLEEDIIGVIYDGKKYFFEPESDEVYKECSYILSRTDDGWEVDDAIALK
jgi:hypothetical protein